MWLAEPPPFIAIAAAIRGALSGRDFRVVSLAGARDAPLSIRR